jgi:subtilisin
MSEILCTLPPDLVVGAEVDSNSAPWHMPPATWNKIWQYSKGEDEVIAILDTGGAAHPDLPKPVFSHSFIGGESVQDGNGHGVHCAGTALGRNGIGAAPAAELMVLKVLSNRGSGGMDGIAQAVRMAVDKGATVISMSIGGGGRYQPMVDALKYARQKGVCVVAAAGNNGHRGGASTVDYPGRYSVEDLLDAVASYRRGELISDFSSGGKEVNYAFPGSDIISASIRGGRVSMSGTSMATPGAAGAIAVVNSFLRRHGFPMMLESLDVRRVFRAAFKDAGAPGRDDRFGEGILQLLELLDAIHPQDLTDL